jgi:acetyltransferase
MHPVLKGRNIGIITHAGGPAVMLTDALAREGFNVPQITHPKAQDLLKELFPGASVANPIDFLATGTAEQLGRIIDYTDRYFDEIDGMAVIFGTPGLSPIYDVYEVLEDRMKRSVKPIFPILPSTLTAADEVKDFIENGRINFPDEVLFAKALGLAYSVPSPSEIKTGKFEMASQKLQQVLEATSPGYLTPQKVSEMLQIAGIHAIPEQVVHTEIDAVNAAAGMGFPVVMKVIGPLHKSDAGGVKLDIRDRNAVITAFRDLMRIRDAKGVLVQPMIKGQELFAGIKYEDKFGHLILCGMGGIFIEVLKDFSSGLAPLSIEEATRMVESLKMYPVLKGARGQKGINLGLFVDILLKLSALVGVMPGIKEMDLNPLIASGEEIYAVDARIRIG